MPNGTRAQMLLREATVPGFSGNLLDRDTLNTHDVAATDEVWVSSDINGWNHQKALSPLIFVHGAGYSTALSLSLALAPNHHNMLQALSQFFTVYVSDFNGDCWGSIEHINRIEEARLYLNSNWGTSGKVTLVGVSMGGVGVLNYTKAYPNNVRAVLGFTPVVNLQRFRDENFGGPAAIDPKYNTWYSDAVFGSSYNPAIWADTLPWDIPVHLMYSSTDFAIPIDTLTDFQLARPSTVVTDVGTLGHAEFSLGVALPSILQWIRYLHL